jgi:hypothetical protein
VEDCNRQSALEPQASIIRDCRHCPTVTSGQPSISNANGVPASSSGLGRGTRTHPGKPVPTTSNRKAVVADPLVPHTRLRINTVDRRNRVAVGITWWRVTQDNFASSATLGYGRNPVGIHQGRHGGTTIHNRYLEATPLALWLMTSEAGRVPSRGGCTRIRSPIKPPFASMSPPNPQRRDAPVGVRRPGAAPPGIPWECSAPRASSGPGPVGAMDWACFDKTDREIEVYVSCF